MSRIQSSLFSSEHTTRDQTRSLRRAACAAVWVACGLVGACGHSPPTQFFTLAPVRTGGPTARFAGSPVQIGAVHIPAELDRPERVVETGRDRLAILEQQRWGSPLSDLIQRILTEDLRTRLPEGMVLSPREPAPPNARHIVVDVEEFEPEPDGRVVLDVSWTLLTRQPGTAGARAMQRFDLPSGGGNAEAQVAAMSQLIGRLADAITSTLKTSA